MQFSCLPHKRIVRALAIVGCCAITLAGCGKKSAEIAGKGQVIGHIGDEVITIQELDNEFRWANVPPDRQKDPDTIKRVLGDLVVRKYVFQQAVNSKLDREPSVLLDLLRAREQVLATVYLNRKIAAKPPGKADIDRYIAENPAKFGKRRLLAVDQVGFALGNNAQSIIDANKSAKTLEEVDQQLTSIGVPHTRSTNVLSSGDLPQDLLDNMDAGKADDVLFARAGANGIFFKLKGEELRPLEGEAANNMARQLLRADALKAETGLASMSANIEAKFDGDYANIMRISTEAVRN